MNANNQSPAPETRQHQAVRDYYARIAREHAGGNCGCGPACCPPSSTASPLGYNAEDLIHAPAGANLNLGCGNPVGIAAIREGETVLDLGCGAGFDCFLAARRLQGTGRVIGVDMTPEMIERARANARRAGFANVEFRLGHIESLPVEDNSVDLIISNCVINLSPDKPAVFREAFRILKPGGRLAVADIVARAPLPDTIRNDLARIAECAGGAETGETLRATLAAVGFVNIRIEPNPLAAPAETDTVANDTCCRHPLLYSALIRASRP